MHENSEGVARYLLMSKNPGKDGIAMFSQKRFFGKEGYLLPIKAHVKTRVHDAIAEAGDLTVVKELTFHLEPHDNPTPTEIETITNEFLERLSMAKLENETPFQTFARQKETLNLMRNYANSPARETSDYAYKFGFATAFNVLNGKTTGTNIPLFPDYSDISKASLWEKQLMETAGYHVEWCALASLGKEEFKYSNNPFDSILKIVGAGVTSFELSENNSITYTLN
jgi:hypothetical protein